MDRTSYIEKKRATLIGKNERALRDLALEETLYLLMPHVDDERLVPKIYINHVEGIDEIATLKWGDDWRNGTKFEDEEVIPLMETYPPIGMAMKKHLGSASFVPIEHWEAWYMLYHEREVPQRNNSTVVLTQVAPFIMEVSANTYEHTGRHDSLRVRWYSMLGKYLVECNVYLDPVRDASNIEREVVGGPFGRLHRDKVRRFDPVIGGNWSLLTWSTGGGPSSLRAAVYWPYPDEDYMTWKSVIDYVYREIHKEKLREQRAKQD